MTDLAEEEAWARDCLREAPILGPGFRSLEPPTFSWPLHKDGTISRPKERRKQIPHGLP
jgi:hypothetical protein